MEITELLAPSGILLGADLQQKDQVLDCLTQLAVESNAIQDGASFRAALAAREEEASTDFGQGLAVPHAQGAFSQRPAVVALVLKKGIPWGGAQDSVCDVFFCIAAPKAGGEYLQTLACLMSALRAPGLGEQLRTAKSPRKFIELLLEAEKMARTSRDVENGKIAPRILAVTGCPTGIAHTYLAADALEKAAAELGVTIKVETNGSAGVSNELTPQDIQHCEAVIVAADKQVNIDRFVGKRVIFASVSAGVYHASQLVNRAVAGEAPVYHPGTDLMAGEILPATGTPRGLYRHLMNGVSHMLPFVVAGGILMTLGMLLDDYQLNPFNFGGNLPLAAFLTMLGKTAFGFMLPVTAGYIARSIAGLPALAVGFVGGALAAQGINFDEMSGGASGGFLGAMLAGLLAGYTVMALQSLLRKIPDSIAAIKPTVIYPFMGVLIVGTVICLINPLLGQMNHTIETALHSMEGGSRILLGAVLGGMMALDMGGPVNKVAYIFATAALISGDLDVMAAVMAGGMAPPLAMGLCTTLFPRGFNPAAKRTGTLAYVLGLCFITEGAVPFAVADPLRAIPCCVASGMLAGGCSMAFGCTLGAPQGGIFMLPLINRPAAYLAALFIGSLVGGLLYGLLRRLAANKVVNKQ